MSAAFVSFLFTLGASTWLYLKFQKYSGNNTRTSAVAASVAALVIFFVFYSIFKMIVK